MIVYNFDVFCIRTRPAETNSELIVYTNAVLVTAIAFKRFQSVTRWNT